MISTDQKKTFCIYFRAAYADLDAKSCDCERRRFCHDIAGVRLSDPQCNNRDFDNLMAAVEATLALHVEQGRVNSPSWWSNKMKWRQKKGSPGSASTRQRWRARGGLATEVEEAIAALKEFGCNQAYIDGIARATRCLAPLEFTYEPRKCDASRLQPMLTALRRTLAAKQKQFADNIPF